MYGAFGRRHNGLYGNGLCWPRFGRSSFSGVEVRRRSGIRQKFFGLAGRPGLLFAWFFLRVLLFPSTAVAQIPPAGEMITSQSVAFFEQDGMQLSVVSNEVTLRVLPLFGPLLTPDGTTGAPASIAAAFSGERVTFPYLLSNTGNADDLFELTVSYLSPSDFVPVSHEIYLDMDGDSLIDPGEPVLSTAGPLPSGASAALILAVDLPDGLTGGETAHVDLAARSVNDTSLVDEGNVVRVVARDEARVDLVKSSSTGSLMPGETVTFTVGFTNGGERAASAVVLSDAINRDGNTEGALYVGGSASASPPGTIEYYDTAAAQWVVIAPPADRVGGVRLLIADLPASASGTLTFSLIVPDDQPAGPMYNTTFVDFTGGDGRPYTMPKRTAPRS